MIQVADGTLLTNEKLEEIIKTDLGEEMNNSKYSSSKHEEGSEL